jgi:hypothetical protein
MAAFVSQCESAWNMPQIRGGPTASGVEGLPGTVDPLDPEPGLGGILSLGLFHPKASSFLKKIA